MLYWLQATLSLRRHFYSLILKKISLFCFIIDFYIIKNNSYPYTIFKRDLRRCAGKSFAAWEDRSSGIRREVIIMKSEVYNQSNCIVGAVAWQYYIEGRSRAEIAQDLHLSHSTLSRLLKRAREEKIIEFRIAEPYASCHNKEEELRKKYGLSGAVVVPVPEDAGEDAVKKQVAMEGARYLQRVIGDGDILGFTWGGTMYHLIQYLNPCRKVNARFVTMHGNIEKCDKNFEVDALVRRAAMAFGGKNISIRESGLCASREELLRQLETPKLKSMETLLQNITIAVSGIGSLYPEFDSPLVNSRYLDEEGKKLLKEKEAFGDIVLRFIDKNGQECDTPYKDRTLSIPLEEYRRIPHKILVASGVKKADTVRAALRGGLADVLILDHCLAEKILS